jgi:hypothetical protein
VLRNVTIVLVLLVLINAIGYITYKESKASKALTKQARVGCRAAIGNKVAPEVIGGPPTLEAGSAEHMTTVWNIPGKEVICEFEKGKGVVKVTVGGQQIDAQ